MPANGSSCVIYVHLLGFPSIFLCINRDRWRGEWALDLVYTIRYPPSCGRVRTVVDVPRSCGNYCSASTKISKTSSRFSRSSPNVSTVSKQHSLRDDYFDYAVIIYCIRTPIKKNIYKWLALVEKLYFSKNNMRAQLPLCRIFYYAEHYILYYLLYSQNHSLFPHCAK